jgi:hypothetical protein
VSAPRKPGGGEYGELTLAAADSEIADEEQNFHARLYFRCNLSRPAIKSRRNTVDRQGGGAATRQSATLRARGRTM